MGDRAQVLIEDVGVYLYTHWYGEDLPEIVRVALSKRWRWNDPEYLARIVFSEMIKDEIFEETGYGIGTSQHGDVSRIVTVNCGEQTVTLLDDAERGWTFEEYISEPKYWFYEDKEEEN